MEQIKALNALEPFLALTKTTTSPVAAADIIKRATSSPNTFVFTELLETPAIQNLAASEQHAPYLTALQIFSYGTYMSYKETPNLPPLNEVQTQKLRQLSLLTLAKAKSSAALTYSHLIQTLGLSTARELESLVISATYAGLLKAQLDPKNQTVHINSVAALRDVAPGAVGGLLTSLEAWAARCDNTLASLEAQMARVRDEADQRAKDAAEWRAKTESLVDAEKTSGGTTNNSSTGGGGGGLGGSLLMGIASHSASTVLNSLGSMIAAAGSTQRYGKRGSDDMDGPDKPEDDDGAMDLDDEGESSDSKKRGSKRKLQG